MSSIALADLWPLALAWCLYALAHSLLAATSVKRWFARHWPALMPAYRLAFNAFALVALVPVLVLVHGAPGQWLWRWTGLWAWLANGLALAALAGVMASARAYDMDEFLGLRQWRQRDKSVVDREGFAISAFHRHVRHPWYFLGLVLVWTRDMNPSLLLSALAVTFYFLVGSRLEERKLVALYGEAYRRYMERVPGLFPLPWRRLGEAEARELAALSAGRPC